jgi:hypothetical protein
MGRVVLTTRLLDAVLEERLSSQSRGMQFLAECYWRCLEELAALGEQGTSALGGTAMGEADKARLVTRLACCVMTELGLREGSWKKGLQIS